MLTTNTCCSFHRQNHDFDPRKGYYLCSAKDGKITREVKVGPEPEGVGVSPDGKLVVATSEVANLAHFIDAMTGKLLDSVPVGSRPRFVLFLNGGRTVWVSSEQRGTISVFDAATHKIVHTIDLNADFDIAEPVQAIAMRATVLRGICAPPGVSSGRSRNRCTSSRSSRG